MKFIVDAQLPQRLARTLAASGHDVLHTLDLPQGNRTPDAEITTLADKEGRVVVTKDSDFVTTFLLRGEPAKLLLISTGNIANDALCQLLTDNLAALERVFATHGFVEMSASAITIHS
jgi:predicted nuclease of predicted toxin-antitoxin system